MEDRNEEIIINEPQALPDIVYPETNYKQSVPLYDVEVDNICEKMKAFLYLKDPNYKPMPTDYLFRNNMIYNFDKDRLGEPPTVDELNNVSMVEYEESKKYKPISTRVDPVPVLKYIKPDSVRKGSIILFGDELRVWNGSKWLIFVNKDLVVLK